MKAIVYKEMKRHGQIRKTIIQIMSMRVSWFVAIADYAENCIYENEKNFDN